MDIFKDSMFGVDSVSTTVNQTFISYLSGNSGEELRGDEIHHERKRMQSNPYSHRYGQ